MCSNIAVTGSYRVVMVFFLEALGEAALLDVAGHLPVAVVRPSIVLAAWREPM